MGQSSVLVRPPKLSYRDRRLSTRSLLFPFFWHFPFPCLLVLLPHGSLMSLFKLLSFFLLFFASTEISTARFAPSRTPPRLGVEISPVSQRSLSIRPQNAFHQHAQNPSRKGRASRPKSSTFRLYRLRNGRRHRRKFPAVSDTPKCASFESFSFSPSQRTQGKHLPALLTPVAVHAARSVSSSEIRRPKRIFNYLWTYLLSDVCKVELTGSSTSTLASTTSGCTRMPALKELTGDFESAAESRFRMTWKHLSLPSEKFRSSSVLCERKTPCESSFFKDFDIRSPPIKVGSKKTLLYLSRNFIQLPSSVGLSTPGVAIRIFSRPLHSRLISSRPRPSFQTFPAVTNAPFSTSLCPASSASTPQPSIHSPARYSYHSFSAYSVSSSSPPSSPVVTANSSPHGSFMIANGLLSTEATSTSQWPPWLPYGLPPEGILPRRIAESTSASSLQYAKKVFLELLESGRLTRGPFSSFSSALASPAQAEIHARAATDGRDKESEIADGAPQPERNQRVLGSSDSQPYTRVEDNTAQDPEASFVAAEPSNIPGSSIHPADTGSATPPLREEHTRIFAAFAEKYVEEVALSGRLTAQTALNILASTWQLAWKYSNYPFKPYHKALRSPLDFSAWSETMWRPLIDLSRSKIVLPVPDASSISSSSSPTVSSSVSWSSPIASHPSTASPISNSSVPSHELTLSSSCSSTAPCSPPAAPAPKASTVEGSRTGGEVGVAGERLLNRSGVSSPLQMIKEKLEKGENIVFLSNHQTEPDPQVLKLVFEHLGERDLGQRVIFVAGHNEWEDDTELSVLFIDCSQLPEEKTSGRRVREDPMSTPFSLGCNLLCVHSRKHLTSTLLPAAEQHRRQQQNVAAMAALQQVLEEGAALVWVAPSGGRDRQDETGHFSKPDKFDSKAVRMFRLLAKKAQATARKVTHFCPMAFYTAPICPPPKKVEGRLGEPRTCAFSPVGMGIGNFLSNDESCTHEAFTMEAEAETRRLYELIKP